ncbi:MAG TPA: type II toxin-antitoxin system death-on-curing family toxin [Burkholderiaceae bacterium]|nr:type II toxin-antitoxin system death-on-curing family toxin [Burkholderiaceae bacterium]
MKEPARLDQRDALALHEKLILLHGGAPGIHDEGLLRPALARPQQMLAYAERPDLVAMAAAYTVGIVQNHPFVDGNKRVGFVLGVLFLEINGFAFSASEEEAAQAVIGLAAGEIDEFAYVSFLRTNATRRKRR